MFAMTVAAADRHPTAAMIFGPTLWWYPDGDARDWVEPTYRRAGRVHRPPTLLRSLILLQQGHVPCTCSVLIRRTAVEAVGGFDVRFRLYEDQTLWVKLFSRYDVYITPVPLSRYVSTRAPCPPGPRRMANTIAWARIPRGDGSSRGSRSISGPASQSTRSWHGRSVWRRRLMPRSKRRAAGSIGERCHCRGGAGASAAASGGRSTVWGASASWRPRAWPR